MTATATRSTGSLIVPPTQNSAPVHEYRCLYTHDVRRKQKRWQDGRVKFHTFNKRVMVYDDQRNFIGDSHFTDGGELLPDDEVRLDVGVLVQIGDLVTTTQTDLAPLLGREKKKQVEVGIAPGTNARSTAVNTPRRPLSGPPQKHRSLNALLQTPKGSYGRATVPERSPYEERKANDENGFGSERGSKRRRLYTETETSSKLSPPKKTPLWARTADERNRQSMPAPSLRPALAGRSGMPTKQVVDLTSESESQPFSDVTIPSSPKAKATASRTPNAASKVRRPMPMAAKARPMPPPVPARPPSPPISTTNHFELEQGVLEENAIETIVEDQVRSAPKMKSIRIGRSERRSTLMCQQKGIGTSSKTVKRRRPNLYQRLSDLDDDGKAERSVVPTAKQSPKRPIPPPVMRQAPEIQVSSSQTAFETASSSPRRPKTPRHKVALGSPEKVLKEPAQTSSERAFSRPVPFGSSQKPLVPLHLHPPFRKEQEEDEIEDFSQF